MQSGEINVEIAYATTNKQVVIPLTIKDDISVIDAIRLSNIQLSFPEIDINNLIAIGIYGKKVDPNNYKLLDNDRIEIYRPLSKTPNQRRLERLKK